MSNHFHLIISNLNSQPENTKKFIQNLLRNFSRRIIEILHSNANFFTSEQRENYLNIFSQKASGKSKHRVWVEHARSIPIWSEKIFNEKLIYIHDNPVKAGLVNKTEDYKFSSASNYINGDDSVLKIDFI